MIGAIYLTKDFLVELMHQFIAWLPNNGRRAIEISMSFVLHCHRVRNVLNITILPRRRISWQCVSSQSFWSFFYWLWMIFFPGVKSFWFYCLFVGPTYLIFAECRYTETEKKDNLKRSCLHAFLEVGWRIFLNKGKIDFCQFNLRDTSRKNVWKCRYYQKGCVNCIGRV